eukprot:TRINITY_DN4222_c0_g1_i1.p1 TRINITY_DN4222_c0_g1~~TRINITY_DN4222_c0_g1_i1.p1  ORF type:complete len:253 (-),score=68.75 TRINITY_DN4222_c0_g1_i1:92-850(-)
MNNLVSSFRRLSTSASLSASKQRRTNQKYKMEPYPEDRGVQIYSLTGERTKMKDAEDRFKRLDWGMYIRTRGARHAKMHKRTPWQKWELDQHVFTAAHHVRNLDKMMDSTTKSVRHFPNDIYEKYNKMDFVLYNALKAKNAERIRMHGNNCYRFDRWKAHRTLQSKYNSIEKERYEPPGYHRIVNDNGGVFLPGPEDAYPSPLPEPHFPRNPIQTKGRCKELINLRDMEQFYGRIKPWNSLLRRRVFMGSKR